MTATLTLVRRRRDAARFRAAGVSAGIKASGNPI
jgi:hypothetical protein